MGIELTKALFARHAHKLTAGELVVLGYMCAIALDKENGKGQTPGLYFGGWEPLAIALGYDGLSDAAKEKVRRSIKGLREKAMIKPLVAHAQTGERQVYRILVTATGALLPSPNRGTGSEPQEGHNFRGNRGSTSEPPRKNTGGAEDLLQDSTTRLPAQVQTARDDEKPNGEGAHRFKPSAHDSDCCDECGKNKRNRTAHPFHLLRGA